MALGIIGKSYLILYNLILALGWVCVLYLTIETKDNYKKMWNKVEWPLKIVQTAAIMEILHTIVGLVPSNVILTGFQVFSRVFALWGVLNLSPPSQVSMGVPLLLVAWSVTEIIRYGYYVLHLIGLASIIQWFRYTLFIVLYPMGVTGELLCIYAAVGHVKEKDIFSMKMPNRFNVAFDYSYCLVVIMLLYIPIFPQLYFHMFAQRRKILGGSSTVTIKQKAK